MVHMNAVSDNFRTDPGSAQDSTGRTRFAVMKRSHRIEGMDGMMQPDLDGRHNLFVSGISMARRCDDALFAKVSGQLQRSFSFRGKGYLFD
ncbi:hypothetical protein D3C78_1620750 [compost metagenome]